MPTSIGGADIGTEAALHFSGGSGAVSTVIRGAVVLKGLLRIGRLILRTRLGRQGLLRRNLITVFFTVNNPREKFSHRHDPRRQRHRRCGAPATTNKAPFARIARGNAGTCIEQKTLEISAPRKGIQFRHHDRHASLTMPRVTASASTTALQRGQNFFHIRVRRRGVETRICAKLRTLIGAVRRPAGAPPRVRCEATAMSPKRSPKQKRPPEGGRFQNRWRRLSGRRSPGLRRTRPDPAGR